MNEVYIIAIAVVVCSVWLYMSLKGKIEQLGNTVVSKAQPVVTQSVSAYPGAPAVSISGLAGSSDEIAAVVMAAIAAFENDMAGSSVAAVSVAGSAVYSQVPNVSVQKYRRRDSLWVATARYESHKRL